MASDEWRVASGDLGGAEAKAKIPYLPKKILREYPHGIDGGDSPLLWRGARGEANRVDILNDNTLNINTTQFSPTIEIVGFDVKGSSASRP